MVDTKYGTCSSKPSWITDPNGIVDNRYNYDNKTYTYGVQTLGTTEDSIIRWSSQIEVPKRPHVIANADLITQEQMNALRIWTNNNATAVFQFGKILETTGKKYFDNIPSTTPKIINASWYNYSGATPTPEFTWTGDNSEEPIPEEPIDPNPDPGEEPIEEEPIF